jgi:hypothetical protein
VRYLSLERCSPDICSERGAFGQAPKFLRDQMVRFFRQLVQNDN